MITIFGEFCFVFLIEISVYIFRKEKKIKRNETIRMVCQSLNITLFLNIEIKA